MLDYIIVGSGLAGISFAEIALENQKKIMVFDSGVSNSSASAAGIYNPVVLKRLTGLQDAMLQINEMNLFYDKIESKLSITVRHPMAIWRRFASFQEQNDWFAALDRPSISRFLSDSLVLKIPNDIDAQYGFGAVSHGGYVNTSTLLEHYKLFLQRGALLSKQEFDYKGLTDSANGIAYKEYFARHIIFAEGYGIKANPWFGYLPLIGTKGELLTIRVPELQLRSIIKADIFLLPLGNDLYRAGATYNWEDKTASITLPARTEIVDALKSFLKMPFEIVDQKAGIRPTVKDRKPLIGTHHIHKNLHVLNGLGTRGVMLAPYMAKRLFESIEAGMPIEKSINIRRFDSYLTLEES